MRSLRTLLPSLIAVAGGVAIVASFTLAIWLAAGMIVWVSGALATEFWRTGRIRPLIIAMATLPVAGVLVVIARSVGSSN
jgi:hypothetical protein